MWLSQTRRPDIVSYEMAKIMFSPNAQPGNAKFSTVVKQMSLEPSENGYKITSKIYQNTVLSNLNWNFLPICTA